MTWRLSALTGSSGGPYVRRALPSRGGDARQPPGLRLVESQLGEWERAGLLGPDQVEAILEFEQARPLPASRRFGRMIGLVSVLGVVLVAAGVALFVGANWDQIPNSVKLSVLVIAVIGLETGGWHLREAGTHHRVGEALILLGYLLYGGGIHLIAQTYHRPVDDPWLLLWWFLPAIPLAHLARSSAVALAGVGVGYGALAIRLDHWLEGAGPLAWAGIYMAIAAALVAAAEWLLRSGRAAPGPVHAYRFAGMATALFLLFMGGFSFWYDEAPWSNWTGETTGVAVALAFLAGVAALAVLASLRAAPGKDHAAAVTTAWAVVAMFSFAVVWGIGPGMAELLGYAVTNIALLGAIGWMFYLGIVERTEAMVNLGVAAFAVALITRYFEIGLGMLGTGLGFILSGLVLVGIGVALEKLRRRLLAEIVLEGSSNET